MQLFGDNRAVSEVIGAILVFGLIIGLMAIIQTTAVPAQNKEVEFNHMEDVQSDMQNMRSSILDIDEPGSTSSVTVDMGTGYPSHLMFFSQRPSTGSLQAETVGGGDIRSTHNPFNFTSVCGTSSEDSVSTQHIAYNSDYNYLESDTQQIYENTVLYQPTDSNDDHLLRSGQTFIQPESKTINLYPLQGNLTENAASTVPVEFTAGEIGKQTYDSPSVSVPSQINGSQWESMVSSDEVSVTDNGDNVEFGFSGEWTVRCQPIGINQAPEQPVDPDNEDEGSDSTEIVNPAGDNVVALTGISPIAGGAGGVTGTFTNNGDEERVWDEARIAYYSGGDITVQLNGESRDEMTALENFQNVNQTIAIEPGDGNSTEVNFNAIDVDLSGNWMMVQVKYENGDIHSYVLGAGGTLIL